MSQQKTITRTAGLIALWTSLSRVFGYIRDGLGGAILGVGLANDAYLAAFRIPNLLRDLFAEGALSSAFVPTFTTTEVQAGKEQAFRLASIVLNGILIIMAGLVLLGEWGAPWLLFLWEC
jgi:putative peptidoglycan lipid II flippase